MVKVSKGTTNGTIEQSNNSDLKNNQKRLKTSTESADDWSVDSLGDGLRISNERPISHASDEGKNKFLLGQCYRVRNSNYSVKLIYKISSFQYCIKYYL